MILPLTVRSAVRLTSSIFAMPRRNSPNDIADISDLSRLGEVVFDKRQGQRAVAKKHRRNRHYEKQFIRHTLAHQPAAESTHADEAGP